VFINTCVLNKRIKEAPREQVGSKPGVRALGVAQRPRAHALAPGGGAEAPLMQPFPNSRAWEKRFFLSIMILECTCIYSYQYILNHYTMIILATHKHELSKSGSCPSPGFPLFIFCQ